MRGRNIWGFSPPSSASEFLYGSLVWQREWKQSQHSSSQLPTKWQFKSCWRKSVWSASTTGFYKGSNHVVKHLDTWKEVRMLLWYERWSTKKRKPGRTEGKTWGSAHWLHENWMTTGISLCSTEESKLVILVQKAHASLSHTDQPGSL